MASETYSPCSQVATSQDLSSDSDPTHLAGLRLQVQAHSAGPQGRPQELALTVCGRTQLTCLLSWAAGSPTGKAAGSPEEGAGRRAEMRP